MSADALSFLRGWAACLLVFSGAVFAGEKEETSYFLAVPSPQQDLVVLEVIRLDRHGQPLPAPKKQGPFFTIWRSGYAQEKAPDVAVKTLEDWNRELELRGQKAVAARAEMGALPAPIVRFFSELETLRAGALSQPPVLQPLSRIKGFAGWEEVAHFDVLAVPDTLGSKERARALLRAFRAPQKELDSDPGPWLKAYLESLGVKVKSARYWPEYNVFLFEGGAHFREMADVLFNGTL